MKNIVLTNHSIDRIKEFNSTEEEIKRRFKNSFEVKLPSFLKGSKVSKYWDKQADIHYFFHKGLLFTVNDTGEYYVLVTITEKDRKQVKFK